MRVSFLPNHRLVRGADRARLPLRRVAGIGLFPVASELVAPRIASAFGVPRDRIVVTGDPRDDVLLAGDPADRRDAARALLSAALGDGSLGEPRLVLYAPTWRDGATDPGIPSSAEWDAHRRVARAHRRRAARPHAPARPRRLRGRDRCAPTASGCCRVDRLADVNPVLAGHRRARDRLLVDRLRLRARRAGRSCSSRPTSSCTPAAAASTRPTATSAATGTSRSWEHVLALLDAAGGGLGCGARDRRARRVAARRALRPPRRPRHRPRARRDRSAHRRRVALGRPATRGSGADDRRDRAGDGRIALRRDDDGSGLAGHARHRAVAPSTRSRLEGARARVDGVVERSASDASTVTLPAARRPAGARPDLALPSGDYRLTLDGAPPTTRVEVDAPSCPRIRSELFHADVLGDRGRPRAAGLAAARRRRARAAGPEAARARLPAVASGAGRRRVLRELLRPVGVVQPARDRPEPGADATRRRALLERRRRLGRDPRRRDAHHRGQPRVVAGPRLGPGAGRQRLAAQAVPAPPRPARAADLARHDAQAARPRPRRPRPAHPDRRAARARALGCDARAERVQHADLPLGLRHSTARSGRTATRATTCSRCRSASPRSSAGSACRRACASCSTPPPGATTAPRWSTTST